MDFTSRPFFPGEGMKLWGPNLLLVAVVALCTWSCGSNFECHIGVSYCESDHIRISCGGGETGSIWETSDCREVYDDKPFCVEADNADDVATCVMSSERDPRCPEPDQSSRSRTSSYCTDSKVLQWCWDQYPLEQFQCEENEDCLASSDGFALGGCREENDD